MNNLQQILADHAHWNASVHHSWKERGFGTNSGLKPIPGEFKTEKDAKAAADNAIQQKTAGPIYYSSARPVASFYIPYAAIQLIGKECDS